MTGARFIAVALLAVTVAACQPDATPETDAVEEQPVISVVVLETTRGQIAMEMDPVHSSESVQNFLRYVRAGFYDGLTFHRVRPGFMIQAGALTPDFAKRSSPLAPVANEAENGLKNVRGTLAMARTSDAHSATTEFFINLVDNPALDFRDMSSAGFGYAVFGRVIEGMDVVDDIATAETVRRGVHEAWPVQPIVINRAYVRDQEGGA